MTYSAPSNPLLPTPPLPACSTLALFLDLDGTLIEFADRPDAVVVAAGLPPLLRALRERLDGALALISGRALHDIDALLDIGGAAAGLHGGEIRYVDGRRMTLHRADETRLDELYARAAAFAAAWPGIVVEPKPHALALHYRTAPQAAAAVREMAAVLQDRAGDGYMLQPGNHVVELKPAGVDKGGAVEALMRSAPFAGRTPWVLGDDLTDEHAFVSAHAHGGAGIVVGPRRPTAARYALADPQAAHAWLAALLATPPPNSPAA